MPGKQEDRLQSRPLLHSEFNTQPVLKIFLKKMKKKIKMGKNSAFWLLPIQQNLAIYFPGGIMVSASYIASIQIID